MIAPLLSVCLITYNHRKYIQEAIDGVLMQKVNFTWELIIADDFSTDGTREIVLEYKNKYPDFIKLILQEKNVGAEQNWIDLITAPKSQYIAYFEGDDYWTDPLKLQKQIDFLEEHPECSICCHKLVVKHENQEESDYYFPDITGDKIVTKNYLYGKTFIRTCSVVFRNKNIVDLIAFLDGFKVGDTPLFYFYAQSGNIGYIDNSMAVYRIHNDGICSSRDLIDQVILTLETTLELRKRLKLRSSKRVTRSIIDLIIWIVEISHRTGKYKIMREYLVKSYFWIALANKKQRKKIWHFSIKSFLPHVSDRDSFLKRD